MLETSLRVFDAPTFYHAEFLEAAGTRFAADAHYMGQNRYELGRISYILNDTVDKPDTVTVRIFNDNSEQVRTLYWTPGEFGLNRDYWFGDRKGVRSLRRPKPTKPNEPGTSQVLPGDYVLVVGYGDWTDSARITVEADPRLSYSMEDYTVHAEVVDEYLDLFGVLVELNDRMTDVEKLIGHFEDEISANKDTALSDELDSLKTSLNSAKDSLNFMQQWVQYEDDREESVDPPEDLEDIMYDAWGLIETTQGRPDAAAYKAIRRAENHVGKTRDDFNDWLNAEWKPVFEWASGVNFKPVEAVEPVK